MGNMEFEPNKQELSPDPSFEEAIDWYVGSVSLFPGRVENMESFERSWQVVTGQSEQGPTITNPFFELFKETPLWPPELGYDGLGYVRPVVDAIAFGGARTPEDMAVKGEKLKYLASAIDRRRSTYISYDTFDSRSYRRVGDTFVLSSLKDSIKGSEGFPLESRMNALLEYCELDLDMGKQPRVALKKVGRKVLDLIG